MCVYLLVESCVGLIIYIFLTEWFEDDFGSHGFICCYSV